MLLPRAFRFVCHRAATVQAFQHSRADGSSNLWACDTEAPQSNISAGLARSCGRRTPAFVELAIERGAADLQSPRDFGHLAAIMRDREADDLRFHLLQRAHFAVGGEHRETSRHRDGSDRYF